MGSTDMDDKCANKLGRIRKIQASSLRFNPALQKMCKEDLQRMEASKICNLKDEFSPDALKGRRIDCLTDNRQQLKDKGCRLALASTLRHQSDDLHSKPRMYQACR